AVSDAARERLAIFVVRVADGQIERLTSMDWIRVSNLVWLPDASGLIVVAADKSDAVRQLWQVDCPGGNAHRFSRDTDGYGAALSVCAGGNLLAVQIRRESNIWIAPANNLSSARQVTFSSFNGLYGYNGFDWTPDNRIIFTGGAGRTLAIYSMDANGGQVEQLTSAGFFGEEPKVTGDGRFIVFQSNHSGSSEIWRVGLNGRDLHQLTTGGRNLSANTTPDGKWVVYVSSREGRSFVFRVPIDGGEPVRITSGESSNPSVSPDGKLIACGYRIGSNAREQLALVNFEDGALVRLFDAARSASFSDGIRWTPDGRGVCYRDKVAGIWRQDVNGGAPRRLPGLPEEFNYPYSWSRDGTLFAFTRGRTISDAVLFK
ncbi:MAG TPA: hypothetical protein VFV34_10150, partial [Blastocatellia bacterium]|nr:hypothetical protein [Blastocatellia bacterium]